MIYKFLLFTNIMNNLHQEIIELIFEFLVKDEIFSITNHNNIYSIFNYLKHKNKYKQRVSHIKNFKYIVTLKYVKEYYKLCTISKSIRNKLINYAPQIKLNNISQNHYIFKNITIIPINFYLKLNTICISDKKKNLYNTLKNYYDFYNNNYNFKLINLVINLDYKNIKLYKPITNIKLLLNEIKYCVKKFNNKFKLQIIEFNFMGFLITYKNIRFLELYNDIKNKFRSYNNFRHINLIDFTYYPNNYLDSINSIQSKKQIKNFYNLNNKDSIIYKNLMLYCESINGLFYSLVNFKLLKYFENLEYLLINSHYYNYKNIVNKYIKINKKHKIDIILPKLINLRIIYLTDDRVNSINISNCRNLKTIIIMNHTYNNYKIKIIKNKKIYKYYVTSSNTIPYKNYFNITKFYQFYILNTMYNYIFNINNKDKIKKIFSYTQHKKIEHIDIFTNNKININLLFD